MTLRNRIGVVPPVPAMAVVLAIVTLQADRGLPIMWIAGAAALIWLFRRRAAHHVPRLGRGLELSGWLLLAYVAFQMTPLPPDWRPVSLAPGQTLAQFLRLAAYAITFSLVRVETADPSRNPWRVVWPLLAVAGLEAGLGLVQFIVSERRNFAVGTYLHHSHYAAFLTMVFPFAVLSLVRVLRRSGGDNPFGVRPALRACGYAGLSALIFAAILLSASRSAFVATLFALLLMGLFVIATLRARVHRIAAAGVLAVALALGFALISTDTMFSRFANLGSAEAFRADAPVGLWQKSFDVFRAHWLWGCGMGAFAVAAGAGPAGLENSAHSDYLQILAEMGVAGSIAALIAALLLLRIAVLRAVRISHTEPRLMAVACTASLAAMLLICLVESTLYVPANALLLFWIGGMAAGVAESRHVLVPLHGVRSIAPKRSARSYRSAYA